jgi:hypothetical protein
MRGGGSSPPDLRTFARNPTIPKEVADASIYDKRAGAHANFYEKAHFVKPTWRPRCVVNATALCPSRYASIRTLSEFTLR